MFTVKKQKQKTKQNKNTKESHGKTAKRGHKAMK